MISNFAKKWKRETVPTDVWFNRNFSQLPEFQLHALDSNVFASYSGPDCGLAFLNNLEKQQAGENGGDILVGSKPIAGCQRWNIKNRKAYGISMSLYDQHPVNGKITGDPIADCFGLCSRGNSSVMIVADGVNWGDKSRLAARCAVYGAMKHINDRMFSSLLERSKGRVDRMTRSDSNVIVGTGGGGNDDDDEGKNGVPNNVSMSASFAEELGVIEEEKDKIETTKDVFRLLLTSLEAAHRTILMHDRGLTTLCVCLVCPIASSPEQDPSTDEPPTRPLKRFAACVVNVGDSLAFVFSRRHGVREITTGSHDVTLERNIRDTGGALGPVCAADEPELNNLTCSMTCVEAGDIVFLATDGITDNFDPVVTKIAVPKRMDPNVSPFKSNMNPPPGKVLDLLNERMQSHSNKDGTSTSPAKRQSVADEVVQLSSDQAMHPSSSGGGISGEGGDDAERGVEGMTIEGSSSPITTNIQVESSSSIEIVASLLKENDEVIGPLACQEQDVDESKDTPLRETGLREEGSDTHLLEAGNVEVRGEESLGLEDGKPVMLPFERHRYAIKEMERVIHEFELFTECPCSAQELCGALLQHVLKLTDQKRKVLENPDLYGKKKRLKAEQRQNRDSEIILKLAQSPGKLDHATVIGYDVGCYHGNEDEDYCIE